MTQKTSRKHHYKHGAESLSVVEGVEYLGVGVETPPETFIVFCVCSTSSVSERSHFRETPH